MVDSTFLLSGIISMSIERAEKKLREAQFFLDKMRDQHARAFGEKEPIDFYLSAFLNAAKTVDYMLARATGQGNKRSAPMNIGARHGSVAYRLRVQCCMSFLPLIATLRCTTPVHNASRAQRRCRCTVANIQILPARFRCLRPFVRHSQQQFCTNRDIHSRLAA